jgi:hypothetical protein
MADVGIVSTLSGTRKQPVPSSHEVGKFTQIIAYGE